MAIFSLSNSKEKNLRLDVIHCYSLSDFRFPGFWSNMKGAYTIFGPVGGGQRCPKALIRYDDKSHYLRDFVNWLCKVNPMYALQVKNMMLNLLQTMKQKTI